MENDILIPAVEKTATPATSVASTEAPEKTYERPDIAYPTIGVFLVAVATTFLSCLLGTGMVLPVIAFHFPMNSTWWYWISSLFLGIFCFIVSTICSYTQFTVAHDAIHRSVSKKYKSLNDWIGWCAQLWLGPTSSWDALKYNHLTHHAHTNNPEYDPDYWCSLKGPGGKYLTPLRWMFVDISYYQMYLNKVMHRPWLEQVKAYGIEIFKTLFLVVAYQWGYLPFLLQYWILPARLSLFLLAYAFDFLPHFPHEITRKTNKYKTTAYLYTPWIFRPLLSLLIFYQNYHIAHHLKPNVPFYRYKNVWEDMKNDLLEEGIIVRDILPTLIEQKIVDILGDDEFHQLKKCNKED